MKLKDKIFLFLTTALIILFGIKTLNNYYLFSTRPMRDRDITIEVLNGLEAKGIVPKEAGYYEVIDE